MKRVSFIFLFLALLFIPLVQLIKPSYENVDSLPLPNMDAFAPPVVENWTVEDIPLGNTEAVSESALKTLKLDSFVQRSYKRAGKDITVYIAYWKPGTMDTRLVASHTPDRCWVENGWSCEESRNGAAMDMNGLDIVPVQYRRFKMKGHSQTVYYWLMVNGQRYQFGDRLNTYPNPLDFFRDFFKEVLRGRPEHYFVRISSNMSAEELADEPLFIQIIKSLEPVGISSSNSIRADTPED